MEKRQKEDKNMVIAEIQIHSFKKEEFNAKNKLAEQVQRDGIRLI